MTTCNSSDDWGTVIICLGFMVVFCFLMWLYSRETRR